MTAWEEQGNRLYYTRKQSPGCIYAGFGIIGILMTVIGLIGLGSQLMSENSHSLPFMFLFMLLLGIVFIFGGFGNSARRYKESIAFDREEETVSFYLSSMENDPFILQFGNLVNIQLVKTWRTRDSSGDSTAGSSGYWAYEIYLLKKDGSEYWIAECPTIGQCTEYGEKLATFTGLALKSGVEGISDIPAEREFKSRTEELSDSGEKSRFVDETVGENGTQFTLRQPQSISTAIIIGIVFALFVSAPVFIIFNAMASGGPAIVLIFVGIFCAAFGAGIFLFFLMLQKKYRVTVTDSELTINLDFTLLKSFNREIRLPKERIRSIRTNRVEGGHFVLAVAVEKSVEIPAVTSLLTSLGAFRKENISLRYNTEEKIIPLWEISVWTKPGTAPTAFDIQRLEIRMQEILGLTEEKM